MHFLLQSWTKLKQDWVIFHMFCLIVICLISCQEEIQGRQLASIQTSFSQIKESDRIMSSFFVFWLCGKWLLDYDNGITKEVEKRPLRTFSLPILTNLHFGKWGGSLHDTEYKKGLKKMWTPANQLSQFKPG